MEDWQTEEKTADAKKLSDVQVVRSKDRNRCHKKLSVAKFNLSFRQRRLGRTRQPRTSQIKAWPERTSGTRK